MEENSHTPDKMTMPQFSKEALILLRWVLGGLFLYAGVSKAMNPDGFMADLGKFQLLPELLVVPVAIYLPFLEILAGLALVTGIFCLGGLFLTKGMLLAFSVGLVSAWWRGLDITCGCFGRGFGDLPVQWALLRNGFLLGLCLVLALAVFRSRQPVAVRVANADIQ